ncbi:unnamed protein product [Phaedon cochleariae]|uniref:CWH43-like N-terminal domain-containing protein n=1 Tax=Phaedon cochleariae TaxID=80249 RepID=A0A9P0DQC3_PHACE|nr:unnamed protein product [Phaedon cochleariae]
MMVNSRLEQKKEEQFVVHFRVSFKHLCLLSVSCPFLSLMICLLTAYIFQYNDIHESHCQVFNIIPSISSITGISPQRYLWRISIAFHVGPRLIISAVYRAYHLSLINRFAQPETKLKAQVWLNSAFMLNAIETGALCGVTYISNRENYAWHEKLFIIFMISSLTHMFACIHGIEAVAESRNNKKAIQRDLQVKQFLLYASLIFTGGLVGFFMQHRYLCHRMAFSMFALCEYLLAIANMAFHISLILDFPTEYLLIAKKISQQPQDGLRDQKLD